MNISLIMTSVPMSAATKTRENTYNNSIWKPQIKCLAITDFRRQLIAVMQKEMDTHATLVL
jgi:hypothetical protein